MRPQAERLKHSREKVGWMTEHIIVGFSEYLNILLSDYLHPWPELLTISQKFSPFIWDGISTIKNEMHIETILIYWFLEE